MASIGIGVVVGAAAAAACIFLLGIVWPLGVGIGAAVGVGAGLLLAPTAPSKLEIVHATPVTVEDSLNAVLDSVTAMSNTMRRLQSRPLWANSGVDERINQLLGRVRSLAMLPELRSRKQVDGDVHMLYVIGTDYLPTVVNHAIENDRMHSSFSGASSRAQVEQNVQSLDDQLGVLSEVLDRIENDIARGKTQSIQEHAAFLKMRFEQSGTTSVLDLQQPLEAPSAHELPSNRKSE
ncbi:YtxH domain-containing protein [Gulosibacter molinativorax]|uniref:YtxH domain-containing protein n=2 Tax=Gulosibacter molinativorax TaxID=256821 RepID=A0ABT7C5X1_9MICO|nr:YtxH domain-containing protein [Gulosibacter molinativorax]